jgi:hypothetical protein
MSILALVCFQQRELLVRCTAGPSILVIFENTRNKVALQMKALHGHGYLKEGTLLRFQSPSYEDGNLKISRLHHRQQPATHCLSGVNVG